MPLVFYRRLTWGQGACIFGAIGLALLGLALYMAWGLGVELRTWPRVQAHVDSAKVASETDPPRDLYSARLWVTYPFGGRTYSTSSTGGMASSSYGWAVRTGESAVRAGTIEALIDPAHPASLKLRPGATWEFFADPLILGGFGLVFAAIGALCLRFGLQRGFNSPGVAYAQSSSPRLAAAFCVTMGVLFIGGAIVGFVVGLRQTTVWVPGQAHVDSTDVVQQTESNTRSASNTQVGPRYTYAVRSWLTYELNERTYRAPLVASTSHRSYDYAQRSARDAASAGPIAVMINPRDPYDIASTRRSQVNMIVLPLVFGFFGVVCLAAAVLFKRLGKPTHRAGAGARSGGSLRWVWRSPQR